MPLDKKDEIGALWIRESKASKKMFLTGTINGIECVAFANDRKKNPKEPDWRIYKSQPRADAARNEREIQRDYDATGESATPF